MQAGETIQDYIKRYPREVQDILQEIRRIVQECAPEGAGEEIKYGVPTLRVNAKNRVHYGAYPKHVSLYPASDGMIREIPELGSYRTGKGTLQFKLAEEIPYHLIKRACQYLLRD